MWLPAGNWRWLVACAALGSAGAAATYATEESHPHLEDMVNRVFVVDEATTTNEAALDTYLASRPGPRAGVVFLLKDLRFNGKPYKQNAKWGACSYIDQAIRSVGSLVQKGSLLAKYPKYPILLYHADWTPEDMRLLEKAAGLNAAGGSVRAWWQKVAFGPSALPPYLYDANRTVAGWRELHVQGDLNQATKANIHGFGYMLMCRFYAGLIHHAPLARRLDFYLRIDGDSRLSKVDLDPFAFMADKGFKYGTLGGSYKEIVGVAAALPAAIAKMHPTETFETAAWAGGGPACSGHGVACPRVVAGGGGGGGGGGGPRGKKGRGAAATAAGAAGACSLHCPLQLPDRPSDIRLPVPLCKGKSGGAPRCPAFYNNFEVVDMRAFRTPRQWEFFLLAERSHAFLCEAYPTRSRPNKCGGGGMGDAIFRTLQVNTFIPPAAVGPLKAHIAYHHPVPIAKFCGPSGTTDGGPPVQKIH